MAAINNPVAVRHCNEKGRVFADALLTVYDTAKKYKTDWDANSIGTLIPNTADLVEDGSATDGRYPCTGAKFNALYTLSGTIITFFETGTPSRIDQIRQVAVNGGARW